MPKTEVNDNLCETLRRTWKIKKLHTATLSSHFATDDEGSTSIDENTITSIVWEDIERTGALL